MAEWLCSGLQSRVRRFDSDPRLQSHAPGTIESVELVAGSEKLVKLKVAFGDGYRSVLAGIRKERNDPKAELEGRQALFVVNLPPRTMAGHTSEAMLFDVGYADGMTPVLAIPERPVPNGARLG